MEIINIMFINFKKQYLLYIGCIGFIVTLFIIISPNIVAMIENNIACRRYMAELTQLKPKDTFVYKTYSKIGILVGNGNHCDFFNLAIFCSQLDPQEVKHYYKNAGYNNEIYFLNNDTKKILELLSDYYIGNMAEQIKNEISKIISEHKTYYILYSFFSHQYNGDWRCI